MTNLFEHFRTLLELDGLGNVHACERSSQRPLSLTAGLPAIATHGNLWRLNRLVRRSTAVKVAN